MLKRLMIATAAPALLVAACGDDDSSSTTIPGGTTGAGGEATTTAATSADVTCETLVTLEKAGTLFGEPAMFDEEASQDVAGNDVGTCIYSSIEDENDLEDLTSHLLQVQVYRGAQYYAPDMVAPDAEHIEGIGDDAYVSGELG